MSIKNKHLSGSLTIQTIRVQPSRTSILSPPSTTPELSSAWCPLLTTIGNTLKTNGDVCHNPLRPDKLYHAEPQQVTTVQDHHEHHTCNGDKELNYYKEFPLVQPLPSIVMRPNFRFVLMPHESLRHIFLIVAKNPNDLENFINFMMTPQLKRATAPSDCRLNHEPNSHCGPSVAEGYNGAVNDAGNKTSSSNGSGNILSLPTTQRKLCP